MDRKIKMKRKYLTTRNPFKQTKNLKHIDRFNPLHTDTPDK